MNHLKKYKLFESFLIDDINWENFQESSDKVISEINRIYTKIGSRDRITNLKGCEEFIFHKDGKIIRSENTEEFWHPKPNNNVFKWQKMSDEGIQVSIGLSREKVEPMIKSAQESEGAYDSIKYMIVDLLDDDKVKFICRKPFGEQMQQGFVKKGDDSSITFEISFVFNGNDVDVSDILNILTEVKGCLSRLGLDFKKDTSTIMYGNGYCGIMFNIPIDCPFI